MGSLIRNERGSILIGSILASMIMVTLVMQVTGSFSDLNKNVNGRILQRDSAENLQTNLTALLRDDTFWNQTLQSSSNISIKNCLDNNSKKSPGDYISPYNSSYNSAKTINLEFKDSDKTVYGSAYPTSGFTPSGEPCRGFSETAGNSNCPFRYEIKWQPLCSDPACTNSRILIVGELKYSSGSKSTNFNPAKYNFSVVK